MRLGDTGHVAIDPERVRLLARHLDDSAADLRVRAARVEAALASVGCSPVPGELRVIGAGLVEWSAALRRRAAAAEPPIECLADPPVAPRKSAGWGLGDLLHTGLDLVGMVPVLGEPADAVNGAWYALEGDWVNASLSAAALIPTGGQAATGGRLVKKFGDEVLDSTEQIARRTNWARADTLDDHARRHGHDFGTTSAEEYALRAQEWLMAGQQRDLPTKIDDQGVIRMYDPELNNFGVFNPDGSTATFYRPDLGQAHARSGWEYWLRQRGKEPWIGGR